MYLVLYNLLYFPSKVAKGGGKRCRPLFKGGCTSCTMASDSLGKTAFCLIDKRKKPSPNYVNGCHKGRLRRSRCTCSVVLHLKHRLVGHKTGIRFVVRSTGSKVHSRTILGGDGQRAYVKGTVPLGRMTHLRRHYSTIGHVCQGSGDDCGHTMFVRMSDQTQGGRASICFCRTPNDSGKGQLTERVRQAFHSGCSHRRPGHKFSNAIDRHGLFMLHGAAPMTIFLRIKGVRGTRSRGHLIVTSGHRTLTG